MDTLTGLTQSYEHQLVYHLLLLKKVMDQYRIWGKRALASDVLWTDPQFQPAMLQLLHALGQCGQHLQSLSTLSPDGQLADKLIRELGQEVNQFTEYLEILLLKIEDPIERDAIISNLNLKYKSIKQCSRQFAELYEQAFPGRLSFTLQSLLDSQLPEMQSSL